MAKIVKESFPYCIPLNYKIFCTLRKLKRQTIVRLNENIAKKHGPADVIPDGIFLHTNKPIPNEDLNINKSVAWIDEDLKEPKIARIVYELNSLKSLLRSNNLQCTSSAGMFASNTYTIDSEKRKSWENAWIILHSGIKAGDKVLDIGGASTIFVFYLASIGCPVTVIDNDWSCSGMIYNTKYVSRKMDWNINVLDRGISRNIPFPDRNFDRIFSICTVEHLNSSVRRNMMREVARVLKPGGIVGLTIDYGPKRKVLLTDKGLRFGYRQKLFDEIINPSGLTLLGNDNLIDTGTEEDGFLGALFLIKPAK